VSVTDLVPPTTTFDANGQRITSVGAALVSTDAVNKAYVDTYYLKVGDGATKTYVDTAVAGKMAASTTLDQIPAPVAAVSLNSKKITNLA
jgi:hypothetical protein